MDDLISRAEILGRIKQMAGCAKCDNYNGVRCRACIWSDAMNIVEEAPAVDAAPVVHGQWIDHKDEHQCSVCKEFTFVDSYVWVQLRYDFCPNCGAKMDGDRRDDDAAD